MADPARMLIPDAKNVLRRAWSVRLAVVSALFAGLSAIEPVLPMLGQWLPRGAMSALASLCAVGVVGARVLAQSNLPEH